MEQKLTEKEVEVLQWVAQGYRNRQIGLKLGCSEQTVKNHVGQSMVKLNASDRTHAVFLAIQHGYIDVKVEETERLKKARRLITEAIKELS